MFSIASLGSVTDVRIVGLSTFHYQRGLGFFELIEGRFRVDMIRLIRGTTWLFVSIGGL